MRDGMNDPANREGARLLADIGATHARFALETAPGRITHTTMLACANYPLLADAVRTYLAGHPGSEVRHAAIAIADPVGGDVVALAGHPWRFSISATRIALGLQTLLIVPRTTAIDPAAPYPALAGAAALLATHLDKASA